MATECEQEACPFSMQTLYSKARSLEGEVFSKGEKKVAT